MKILIINISDVIGGASKACYRLHRSLLEENIDSRMLVQYKKTDDATVIESDKFFGRFDEYRSFLDVIPAKFYFNRLKIPFSTSIIGWNIINKIKAFNPDIIHLHWICGGIIKIEELLKINKPIVWSLHDIWPFTGGCHYSWGCENYMERCGRCKVLYSNKESDLSRWIWNRKKEVYDRIDFTIVGLSRFITEKAQKSSLFKDKRIFNIPNPINTNLYVNYDKRKLKRKLNISENKKVILCGAMNIDLDINKGFDKFKQAVKKINNQNIEILVFGNNKKIDDIDNIRCLGNIKTDNDIIDLYNASDVTVVPSIEENLSNVIMESLSCKTPVVGFNIGGNSDMIEHMINGYLAKPYDIDELAYGIKWVIDNPNYDKISYSARKKILDNFDSKIVVKKYIKLYEDILNCRISYE